MSLFDGDDFPDPEPTRAEFLDDFLAVVAPRPVTGLDAVDLAKVSPCPGCGDPVRRMAAVPTRGHGLDQMPSGPWWCSSCIQAKCSAAFAAVRSVDTTAPLD